MDTFDHVQPDDLKQQGAVAAVFAWYAANWPEQLPREIGAACAANPNCTTLSKS